MDTSDSSLSDPESLKSLMLPSHSLQILLFTTTLKITDRLIPGPTKNHDQLPDHIHEDPDKASVPRVVGGFTPFPPHHLDPEDLFETKLHPVAFVRNSVTIWFDKEGNKWKKGQFQPVFKIGSDLCKALFSLIHPSKPRTSALRNGISRNIGHL